MSETPFMPLKISDFIADTINMDATETGAYLMLLMAQWKWCGQSLPDDMPKLQRIARCARNWPRVWEAISVHFERDADGWFNPKGREVFANVRAKSTANSNNGSLGGKANALKNHGKVVANATVSLKQPEPYREDREDTDANASDASVDFAKQLWDRGVAFLGKHSVPDKQARSLIGKWRKAYTDTDIFEAFAACSKQGIIDPVPWITARLAGKDKPNDKSSRGERFLRSFVAGASVAPGMDFGEDSNPSRPLLARG
jgi:uncharacterized protein YdaU (DUF1376 family)